MSNLTTEDFLKLPDWMQAGLNHIQEWIGLARPKQLPPLDFCTNGGDKYKWFMCGGRAGGKTRAGAETLFWWAFIEPKTRWAVVAPTASDLERVCFEGPSGLISIIPPICIEKYNKSDHIIWLKNGSVIEGFSAEKPNRLRGPNFHGAWADELAAWNDGREKKTTEGEMEEISDRAVYTWKMLGMATRLGNKVKYVMSSTPKPTELIRELYYDPEVIVTSFTTFDNKKNLAENYFKELLKYEGTRLGRQELYAELLEEMEGGIFSRHDFLLWAAKNKLPSFDYVIQSYDTAFTDKTINDRTACTTWGMFVHPKRGSCAMLIDGWADFMKYPDLRDKVEEEFEACVFGEFDKEVDIILVEEKSSGISLIQDLQREQPGKKALPVAAYNPGRDSKFERASLVSYLPVHGKIYIPEGFTTDESGKRIGTQKPTSWANEFLTELCQFTGKQKSRDDYVDSASQAWKFLLEQGFFAGEHKDVEDETDEGYNAPRENPYAA